MLLDVCSIGVRVQSAENNIEFTNSDPDMMQFFIKFVRECFKTPAEEFTVVISCYLNNGLTQTEIEDYWLELLQLPRSTLRKNSCE